MRFTTASVIVGFAQVALSQGLGAILKDAIKNQEHTTLFQTLLDVGGSFIDDVVGDKREGLTILVPEDDAVDDFMKKNSITDFASFSQGDTLKTIFKYHVLASNVSQEDYAANLGLVVPTLLKDEKFNNRTAGSAITIKFGDDATGQVIYFSKSPIATVSKRQGGGLENAIVNIRHGVEQTAKVTVVDGTWGDNRSNKYQLVNTILVPPQPCSTTIQRPKKEDASSKLKALDDALVKTGLYPALDTAKNVTCLAPSTDAFKKAKDPQESLGNDELTKALLFHTLAEVTYTNFLTDGQKIKSLSNDTITVTIDGKDIYFNNAKVVEPNVLTNNGLIHILNAVMVPDGTPDKTSDDGDGDDDGKDATSTGSGSQPTESADNAATSLRGGAGVVLAVVVALALL